VQRRVFSSADFRAPFRLFCALLFVLAAAACDTPEEKEARHLATGIEFAEAGDDAKAMVEFRNVLRLNAKNADALYQVGLIHERAERWVQAFNAFQAAAAERPGDIDANMKIGTLALISNEVAIAEKAAADILAVHPGNPDAEVLDAAVMLRRGDLERAQALAEAVLVANPRHENAVAVVVGVLQARGRTADAVARLDEALVLLTDNINLRALKIALLEQAGDVDRARAAYGELVALEPDNLGHRLALSNFYDRQADFATAETVLRDAIDRDLGTDELGQALVRLVYRERGAAAAEAELRRFIEREPANNRFRFLLAELLTIENRIDDAEAALADIVEGSDTEAGQDAKAGIARLRLGADDRDGARTIADEVLAQNRDHRGANFVRGLVHLLEDQPDEAIRSARTALRRDVSWTPGLKLVAEAHLRKGENDLAISALGEVVSLDAADAAAAEMLAVLLTRRGDLDTALTIWDRLVDTGQDPARALEARAQIRLQQQNWTAAQADIARLLETPGQELGGTVLAGSLDLARNRYAESREWFGMALALEPDSGGPLVGIVRAHVAEGDTDAALAFLEARTTARSDDALAFQMKGELLAGQEALEPAAAAFEAAIALRPEWALPYRQLAALERDRTGDLDDAVAVYERALLALPDHPEIIGDQAMTLLVAERHLEAMDAYGRLFALQPQNDLAANNYAALVADYAYEDPERLERALEIASRFRASNNGWFLDTLGWLHYRKGDYPVAASYLERAVADLADNPQLRYHLGMALKASGQTERARLELQRAVAEGAEYDGLDEAKATLATLEAEAAAAAGG
jgi:cellulose synthase operon protein C